MSVTDRNLTVKEGLEYLHLNGVMWTEVWLRTLIGVGKVRSTKVFNSRVVSREELARIVREHKEKHG